jgi:hypothetical protein
MDWELGLIIGAFTIIAFVALQTMRVSWYLLERCLSRLRISPHPLDYSRYSSAQK